MNCTVPIDYDSFRPTEYFKEYHFVENYDEMKIYPQGYFEHDYGKGIHTYIFNFYNMQLFKNIKDVESKWILDLKYAVAEEKISDEELNMLIPYCHCPICSAYWFNITKYFMCPYHEGCLKVATPASATNHQYIIDETRRAHQNAY